MKRMLFAAGIVLVSVFGTINIGAAQDNITVVSLEIDELPRGTFSIYCSGIHVGNGLPAFWSRRNSFANNRLLIEMSKDNNIVEIQREDKQWDSFRIPFENFPNDGKRHTFRDVRRFDSDHAYTYSVTAIAGKVKKVTFKTFQVPSDYLKKAYGNHRTFTEPVLYMEILSGNMLLVRTEGQAFNRDTTEFIFDNTCYYLSDDFPITVKIYVADRKALEESTRATDWAGAEKAAKVVSGIGCVAGTSSLIPSLGIAATGAAIGLSAWTKNQPETMSFASVSDAHEVVSFEFKNAAVLETQTKICKGETNAEDLKVRLIVK